MLGYYIDLALHSFRRNVSLTTLMIVAIAFGVGASMTTLTVLHVLSADPIPGHSHELRYVQLDHRKARDVKPGEEPPRQVTREPTAPANATSPAPTWNMSGASVSVRAYSR